MFKKYGIRLIGSLFIAMAGLSIFFGVVRADPAKAILSVTVSNRNPEAGEEIVVTFTLDQMDPEEVFYAWAVGMRYSSTILTFTPDSCWFNPDVWAEGTPQPSFCNNPTSNTLYVGEPNYYGYSTVITPILLGTVRFTVITQTSIISTMFHVITDAAVDSCTSFTYMDDTDWIPGVSNYRGPNAVTLQSFIARNGAGVAAGVGLAVAGAGIVLHRKRHPAITNDGP